MKKKELKNKAYYKRNGIIALIIIFFFSLIGTFFIEIIMGIKDREGSFLLSGKYIDDITSSLDKILYEFNIMELSSKGEKGLILLDERVKEKQRNIETRYNEEKIKVNEKLERELETLEIEDELTNKNDILELYKKLIKEENSMYSDYNIASDTRKKIQEIYYKYREINQDIEKKRNTETTEFYSRIEMLKRRINGYSEAYIKNYKYGLEEFYYSIENDDSTVKITNVVNLENLDSNLINLEIRFVNGTYEVKKASLHNTTDIDKAIIDKFLKFLDGKIENATIKIRINKDNMKESGNLYGHKIRYELSEDVTYFIFVLFLIITFFIGSVLYRHSLKNFIIDKFIKMTTEFKILISLSIYLILRSMVLDIKELALFIPIFSIGFFIIGLLGMSLRDAIDNGIIKTMIRKSSMIIIIYKFIKLIKIKDKLDIYKNINKYLLKRQLVKKVYYYIIIGYVYIIAIIYFLFGKGMKNPAYRHIGIIAIMFLPIIIVCGVVKFINKLEAIKRASYELTRGNFQLDLKDKNNLLLQNISDNIEEIHKGFQKTIDGELKSERMKNELINNVSEDLKEPLKSVITDVEEIRNLPMSIEEKAKKFEVLENNSKNLKVLIEDLFEVTKIVSGNVKLDLCEIDIVAILRQSLGEFEYDIEKSDLKFKVNLPNEKVIVELDGNKTWRVFENIIENILKYSLKGSRVYIELFNIEDEVVLIVKNASKNKLDIKLIDIKNRVGRIRKNLDEGSGLGLVIAKSLVEAQGGKMSIKVDGDLFKVTIKFKKKK